ncbi:MAG: hypothetical protein HW413_914 [Thermoleophilia bacterium]|nr:hypothetical protein [Thermoleophilia bacterium]
MRAPHLYPLLRGFVLGSFVVLGRELEEGGDLPFAFEEHVQRGGPALYELRPLVRAFIEEREPMLRAREDVRLAVEELRREPAASIFAHAHAGPRATEDEALFRTVLLGLLIAMAEACGGFDWDDDSFERAYALLESSLYGEHRRYTAVAPLAGISLSKPAELAPGMAVRPFAAGELSTHWPESRGLLPRSFGREPDRNCVLEFRQELDAGEEPRDASAEIADAVSALRLTTSAALAAGPVLFETLDGRPFGIQPVLPIAATQPPGEPSRLDTFRTPIAVEVLAALGDADGDPSLAEALDRWELSLFQNEPFRGEQVRATFAALFGETWPMRCCVLLAENTTTREELHGELVALAGGGEANAVTLDTARKALVAVLRSRDRVELVHDLDRELLGLPRRAPLRAAVV